MVTTRTKRRAETAGLDGALGMAIRTRRLILGMTQEQLGDAIGVSYQQVQKYEVGTNRVAVSTLIGLAKALGMTAAEIVAEVEKG